MNEWGSFQNQFVIFQWLYYTVMVRTHISYLVEHWSFFVKMKKTVELTEPVHAHLWICGADKYNTIGALYDFWFSGLGLDYPYETKLCEDA